MKFIVYISTICALLLFSLEASAQVRVEEQEQTTTSVGPFQAPAAVSNGQAAAVPRGTLPDSLRAAIQKLNLKYVDNIHADALAAEAQKKQAFRFNVEKHVRKMSPAHLQDSLAIYLKFTKLQREQLQSFENSLVNYSQGLNSTAEQLKIFMDVNSLESYPRLKTNLQQQQEHLTLKLDSLRETKRMIIQSIDAYSSLDKEMQLTPKASALEEVEGATTKTSIWKAPATIALDKQKILTKFKNNYQKNESVNKYVNQTAWTSRILLILLSLGYIYWIFSTRLILLREENKTAATPERFPFFGLLAKGLIFFLSLLPLVSIATPSVVIQVAQLLIILLFCFLLRNMLTTLQSKLVGGLLFFYLCIVLLNSVVSDDLIIRITCIVFNFIAIYIGIDLKRKIKDPENPGFLTKAVFLLFLGINLTAIILNAFGHVESSRYFSIAGAVGLVQSFTLRFFIEMMKQDVRHQFSRNRLTQGFFSRFDENRALKSATELFSFVAIILAIMVFASNLQILEKLVTWLAKFFSDIHKIGSIQFNFGNLFVAVIVLLVSNWLQRNLSVLLIGSDVAQNAKAHEKMTLFPLFRLIIFVVGFFIAISALGLSLDKLTVIVGALSVGVGLGLQNIINNFVSGIILVFDKPFRVGDQIELADKKGIVKEIGIRASVLKAGDGSEVIIPNGDLLSGRVVNWTLSHTYGKMSFVIQVDRKMELDLVEKWIKEGIQVSSYAKADMPVSISVQDISADMFYLNITCWIKKIGDASSLKSDLYIYLYPKFESQGYQFYSIAPAIR